ncbi:MAG TPA: heparan-alpha-glucosaminide N-acetyltransferase domain-containing protein, partial [Chitinophagaceae bacterium]|nr:heparan-alpha-glucosaminide N-acetyltransferase domain-containing protein [Chitinophagaceae bacterium]
SRVQPMASTARVRSVDILRGAVMVLMAIDHVRVYSGLPAGGPDPGIFFTRWVTHFCAPAFVFFAGTSAFLYGKKVSKATLSKYLLSRGLLLVLLELTLIRFSWTFNFDYSKFVLAGVIWMIGWCMVLMAALIWLRPAVAGVIGLLIIFFQDVFGKVSFGPLWEFIYPAGGEGIPGITILYVLVPWIGVMAAGYGFGMIVRNKKACLIIGLSAIAAFLIVGSIVVSKNGPGDGAPPFIFQLLNQRKYPASQLFLLMTLGPVIALTPFAEKARGWLADVLAIFGKVPFFYYVLHIPLIHVSAIILNEILGISGYAQFYASAPYVGMPPELRWHLWMLYLVYVIDVVILYVLCRWYVGYKFAHPDKKWLRYL